FNLSFIRENGFEFHPQAVVGEDQLFVMQCYINAKVITVLADYEYYFVVARGNENLSLKYFPAEQFFYSFNRILEFLEESELNELYKRKLKVAFINRFLHASRLRGHLLSNLLTKEQKMDWLNETKCFFDKYVDEPIINSLASRFQYFVRVVKENNINKLLSIHKKIGKVTANDVTRVENGFIYAKLKEYNKECSFDEEHVVNQLNTSEVFVSDMLLGENSITIKGDFTQSLLINFEINYELIFVHRTSGLEKVHRSKEAASTGRFDFTIEYGEILFNPDLTGPWDLFVEASVGGYVKRRRIGSARSSKLTKPITVTDISSFGRNYSIKAYYTKPFNNISLDVKINK
ncbi:hypothetical protein, partial [Cytobacillus firmus]